MKRARCSSGNTLRPPSIKQRIMDSASRDPSTAKFQPPESSSIKREKQDLTEDDITKLTFETLSAGLWVGPMDPAMFLGRFLPEKSGRPKFFPDEFSVLLDIPENFTKHKEIIHKFSRFCMGLEFLDAYSSRHTRLHIVVNVDAQRMFVDNQAAMTEVDFSRVEIPMIFKPKDCDDPFSDDKEDCKAADENDFFPFERIEDKHRLTRGQITSFFSSLTGAQFRLHAFAILICGKWARMLRWDPNGVIVSQRFPCSEDDHLVEFLWRYSQTPPDGRNRGHDPTLNILLPICTDLTTEEAVARVKMIEANEENHREFRTIMVPDRDTEKQYQFIISYPPKSIMDSPFGRATRPMLAFDVEKNSLVFIKDYWRTVGENTDKEGDIYKILHDANVPYIPPFGRGNDVQDHATLTDVVKNEDWVHPTAHMKPLRHYRMSLEKIGRPSNTFNSSHELVTAVADAMEAHDVAFYNANILHRDISAGNILITEDGRGMLIDWDLCLNTNNPNYKDKNKRTGTWEFLSAMLLSDAQHVQGVLDDKESFLYVLLWNMMVYTPYNNSSNHSEEMELFEENRRGLTKQLFLLSRHRKLKFDDRPHLNSLIQELCRTFRVRYSDNDITPEQRQFMESEKGLAARPNNLVVCEKRLKDRFSVLKTIRKHLEPRSEWPAADKPCKNPSTRTAGKFIYR